DLLVIMAPPASPHAPVQHAVAAGVATPNDTRDLVPLWVVVKFHATVLRGGLGLLRLGVESAHDQSEAKAEPINCRDWHDPQPHHEQGALHGPTVVWHPCNCADHNGPKNRTHESP